MPDKKRCFYLPVEGRDTDIVRQGLFWLFTVAKSYGGWFAINTIENLEGYSRYSGLNELTKLKNKYDHAVINGVSIYLITKDWLPADGRDRPLLALHPTKDLLDRLDNIPNIPEMTVVPFIGKEIEDWIKLHDATMLQTYLVSNDDNKQPSSKLDSVVAAALEDYSKRVNFNQGVWENDVKFGSIVLFRILADNGINYDPEAIKTHLQTKLKWNPLAADQAARVAEIIRSGDGFREEWPDIPEPWRTKFWNCDYDSALQKWHTTAKDLK